MASLTVFGIGAALVILIYRYVVYPAFLTPLAKVPNAHWSVPLASIWMERKRRNCTENRTICAAHQRLGPVVRLGPNELSFNSVEALQKIYTRGFDRPEGYRQLFLNYRVENLVSAPGMKEHSEQKRILSRVYSKSYLQDSKDLEKLSSRILSERLLPLLNDATESKRPVDVFPLFEAVGMDFISAYLFGLEGGTNFIRDTAAWARWMKGYEVYKYQSPEERKDSYLENWCLLLMNDFKRLFSGKRDGSLATEPIVYTQLSRGLEKNQDQRPRQLAIASEMLDHVIAGHETSGITFTYIMWQLSQHPKIQEELRKEVLTLSPNLHWPGPGFDTTSSALPSPQAIDSLPVLDAVVRETLRLHAAAAGPQARISPSFGVPAVIEGYTIPPGVTVSSSAHTLHRNPEIFPQPTKWLPERWLDAKPDKIRGMRRMFWAFGSGGKMCLGSNFAMQEIKLVTAAVYTNYTTTIEDDNGIEQEDSLIAPPVGRRLILKFRKAFES